MPQTVFEICLEILMPLRERPNGDLPRGESHNIPPLLLVYLLIDETELTRGWL